MRRIEQAAGFVAIAMLTRLAGAVARLCARVLAMRSPSAERLADIEAGLSDAYLARLNYPDADVAVFRAGRSATPQTETRR
jgi:hypothetical protein